MAATTFNRLQNIVSAIPGALLAWIGMPINSAREDAFADSLDCNLSTYDYQWLTATWTSLSPLIVAMMAPYAFSWLVFWLNRSANLKLGDVTKFYLYENAARTAWAKSGIIVLSTLASWAIFWGQISWHYVESVVIPGVTDDSQRFEILTFIGLLVGLPLMVTIGLFAFPVWRYIRFYKFLADRNLSVKLTSSRTSTQFPVVTNLMLLFAILLLATCLFLVMAILPIFGRTVIYVLTCSIWLRGLL